MGIPFRPLGIVTKIVESMGLGVTYSYEDLVFITHNAFMLRFGEQGELLDVYFNKDCPDNESESIEKQLLASCEEHGLTLSRKGTYELSEKPNQTLSIQFFEDSDGSTPAQQSVFTIPSSSPAVDPILGRLLFFQPTLQYSFMSFDDLNSAPASDKTFRS